MGLLASQHVFAEKPLSSGPLGNACLDCTLFAGSQFVWSVIWDMHRVVLSSACHRQSSPWGATRVATTCLMCQNIQILMSVWPVLDSKLMLTACLTCWDFWSSSKQMQSYTFSFHSRIWVSAAPLSYWDGQQKPQQQAPTNESSLSVLFSLGAIWRLCLYMCLLCDSTYTSYPCPKSASHLLGTRFPAVSGGLSLSCSAVTQAWGVLDGSSWISHCSDWPQTENLPVEDCSLGVCNARFPKLLVTQSLLHKQELCPQLLSKCCRASSWHAILSSLKEHQEPKHQICVLSPGFPVTRFTCAFTDGTVPGVKPPMFCTKLASWDCGSPLLTPSRWSAWLN